MEHRRYKKWFLVDIEDIENPSVLSSFVSPNMRPKGEKPFYEINGTRYDVVSQSKWMYDADRNLMYKEIYVKK